MAHMIGTNCFVSLPLAIEYYAVYGFSEAEVQEKIAKKEIYIGKPDLKPDEKLVLIDGGMRYAIEIDENKTKETFLRIYREEILKLYGHSWAKDTDRLNKFMESVRITITTQANTWNNDSIATNRAWKRLGMKGKATYKALRALTE